MSDLKAGVIGLGAMGSQYARIIKTLRGIKLVGVVDIDEKKLKDFSNELNVKAYKRSKDFLDIEKPDFVVISCPDEYHAENTILALERNIHVHLEKPVADTLENSMEILKASKSSKSKINIGYILRMLPQYSKIKEQVKNGDFGEILHFYTRRSGTLNEGLRWKGRTDLSTYLVCHDADVFMWITGLKINRVYGEEVKKVLTQYNTHDSIQVLLKCDDGAIGVIECSWALPNSCNFAIDNKFELIGTKSAAFLDLQNQGLNLYTSKGLIWPDLVFGPNVDGFYVGALKNEIERFIDSILNNTSVMCSVEEGLEATKVALAAKKSIIENKVVYLKDL